MHNLIILLGQSLYFQLCPVWGAWSSWTDCSVTCGGGTRYQIRECINGETGDEGCMGAANVTESCNQQVKNNFFRCISKTLHTPFYVYCPRYNN